MEVLREIWSSRNVLLKQLNILGRDCFYSGADRFRFFKRTGIY